MQMAMAIYNNSNRAGGHQGHNDHAHSMPIPHLLGLIKPENVTLVPLIINGRLHPQASCLAQVNNQYTIERFYSDLLVVLKVAQLFTNAICKL